MCRATLCPWWHAQALRQLSASYQLPMFSFIPLLTVTWRQTVAMGCLEPTFSEILEGKVTLANLCIHLYISKLWDGGMVAYRECPWPYHSKSPITGDSVLPFHHQPPVEFLRHWLYYNFTIARASQVCLIDIKLLETAPFSYMYISVWAQHIPWFIKINIRDWKDVSLIQVFVAQASLRTWI